MISPPGTSIENWGAFVRAKCLFEQPRAIKFTQSFDVNPGTGSRREEFKMSSNANRGRISSSPAIADDPEKYVRESFTWRTMSGWQVWSLTVVSAALLAAIVLSKVI